MNVHISSDNLILHCKESLIYRFNIKEFSVLVFYSNFGFCFTCILNYALYCVVLLLKEMSVNIMENVLVENYQYLLCFSMDFCVVEFDEKWVHREISGYWLQTLVFVILHKLMSLDLKSPWPFITDVCQDYHRKISIFADPFRFIYSRIPKWHDCCLILYVWCKNLCVWSLSGLTPSDQFIIFYWISWNIIHSLSNKN